MDSYRCLDCGGQATTATGCKQCGKPYDHEAAALAKYQRFVASLEQKKRDLTSEQNQLRTQLFHATAQRDNLRRKLRARREQEASERQGRQRRSMMKRAGAATAGPTTLTRPAERTGQQMPGQAAPGQPMPGQTAPGQTAPAQTAPVRFTRGQSAPGGRPAAGHPETAQERMLRAIIPMQAGGREHQSRWRGQQRQARMPRGRLAGAETTTASMQTTLLVLGGLLLAAAVVTLTVIAFASVGAAGRLGILAVITGVGLVMPAVLHRRGLAATGEAVASVALLMVLLDGYVVRDVDLLGAASQPKHLYYAVVCLATGVVAVVYRATTHLAAPRFAALLLLQPVLPLIAYGQVRGPAGWAAVLAALALLDMGFAVGLLRFTMIDRRESPADSPAIEAALENTAWLLFALAYAASLATAADALAMATTRDTAFAAAAALLLAAGIGVAGGLRWRAANDRDGGRLDLVPTAVCAVATVSAIVSIVRVGTLQRQGYPLLVAAFAVAVVACVVPFLSEELQPGPRLAGVTAGVVTALAMLVEGVPRILAPLRAATPIWQTDLDQYANQLASAAGDTGWQLVAAGVLLAIAAAIMLPVDFRPDGVVVMATVTMLMAPTALGLNWLLTPAVTVAVAVAVATTALGNVGPRTASTCLISAMVLAGYAAAASLTRPGATALTLAAITVAGAAIGFGPRASRPDPEAEMVVGRVTDTSGAGALAALPGAAAAAAAAAASTGAGSTTLIPRENIPVVLATAFIALAMSLAITASVQLSREGRQSRPLLTGATIGTLAVVMATLLSDRPSLLDIVVCMLMGIAVAALWLAPSLDARRGTDPRVIRAMATGGREDMRAAGSRGNSVTSMVRGIDTATAAVTVAAIAAMARAVALFDTSIGLLTVSALVLASALVARALPERWQYGPVRGTVVIGGLAGLYAGWLTVLGAVGVVGATSPTWHADLGSAWSRATESYADFGVQVPLAIALLMAAAAAAFPIAGRDAAAGTMLVLLVIAVPLGLDLGWQMTLATAWAAATGLGIAAALAHRRSTAVARLGAAGVLAGYAIAASLLRPEITATVLIALAAAGAAVAAVAVMTLAARTGHDIAETGHLGTVGGYGVATAMLAVPAAVATAAWTTDAAGTAGRDTFVVTAVLAATAVVLAVAGLACRTVPGYLPFVTGGVAASGLLVIVTSAVLDMPTAVYAAAVALLGVLAELIRANARRATVNWRPARGFRPDRTLLPIRVWRPVTAPGGFGAGVGIAAGIPALIALFAVAPVLFVAVFGPYHWVADPWSVNGVEGAGWLGPSAGGPLDVVAALVLTLAAALVGLGLGGSSRTVANRVVSVVIPGASATLLIAPVALGLPYPAQPVCAMAVAVAAGLAVALTPPPAEPESSRLFLLGRRIAFCIVIMAGTSGIAGSLATREQTVLALAAATVAGLVGAIGGRSWPSRIVSWIVAAGCGQLLALAVGLAIGLPLAECSYPIVAVATFFLGLAGLLPRIRQTESLDEEASAVETTGFLGLFAAFAITMGGGAQLTVIALVLGSALGIAAVRPALMVIHTGEGLRQRNLLLVGSAAALLIGAGLLAADPNGVAHPEAYTIPVALVALVLGITHLAGHTDLDSWIATGPALAAGFTPTLVLVLTTQASTPRRLLLIVVAVVTVAIGALRRRQAPVVIGGVVTAVAAAHELTLLGRHVPWPVLLVLFVATGGLLLTLGATYEKRRGKLRGMFDRMR